MKNILFVCTEGFDTPGPSNHLIASLIEDMLESNFKVTLIQSRRKMINDDLPDPLKNREDLNVRTLNRKVIEKSSFVSRYLEEAAFALRCFRVWRKIKDIDAVFVQSCPTVIFPITLLKLFMKKPILYSVQDMWPGSAVSSGVLSNKLLAKIFYKVQKWAYGMCDVVTVISEDMKEKVLEQGVKPNKVHSIVNWFDDRSVHEVAWNENRFVKKYNLSKNKFYVQYAGTMGYVFDYNMVIRVAKLLEKYENIEFQMIGQGSQKDAFIEEKERLGLNNIVFYPLEPQNMVSDVYSACSICIIPLKKGIIGNSVPSKAGLLMACKRTIINSVDTDSNYYKMFQEKQIGISVSNDNPSLVAKAIIDLYEDQEKREQLAYNGYRFSQTYYARSLNTQKFVNLFTKMNSVERNQ